ncbi:MAG: fluoride efflux transporter CrcB [Ignavibacteriales bacterium]|nr:fluoride efflux transporter CrcB [Ignavibacteriales bacterium]MCF8306087.1 fluoride efflux transporter CrcB [Ignavibacteriales bacterium]MCF8315858.1 fluoride efflux transporter CrcB [Ignavibacteriales bacterium]MCF8437318.1 fluoride efflux transporter CrcB [Ignavibacteriales bacterium]
MNNIIFGEFTINYLFVFFGSAIGGVLRYWLSGFVQKFSSPVFPSGTLAVNFVGSFIIGIVMFYLDSNEMIDSRTKLFLTTGLCGGLTTFSTFSYESFQLLKDSEILLFFINITSNVLLTLLAVFLAFILSNIINGRGLWK